MHAADDRARADDERSERGAGRTSLTGRSLAPGQPHHQPSGKTPSKATRLQERPQQQNAPRVSIRLHPATNNPNASGTARRASVSRYQMASRIALWDSHRMRSFASMHHVPNPEPYKAIGTTMQNVIARIRKRRSPHSGSPGLRPKLVRAQNKAPAAIAITSGTPE